MNTATVLVVEDEALVADDVQRTLRRLGYLVPETAASAEEALELTPKLNPQLVLMDIHLAGAMDGIEAAEQIRLRHGVPVIFLTAYSNDPTLERAKRSEPFGYLVKPFSERELRTAIEVGLHRHRLESELLARERWFKTTLQCLGDAVIAVDPEGTVTFMNHEAESLTNVEGAVGVGQPLANVFRLTDAGAVPVESPLRQVLMSRKTLHLEPNLKLTRDGLRPIDVDDSVAPIVDDFGRLLGAVLVFRDLTLRNALEERLRHTERLASIGTLSAGIAHELSNPLTYVGLNASLVWSTVKQVSGALEHLRGSMPESAATIDRALADLLDVANLVEESQDGLGRAKQIIDGVRRFAHTDTPKTQRLAPEHLVNTALTLLRPQLTPTTTVKVTHDGAPEIEGHEGQLLQVLTNLIMNAVQAMAGRPKAKALLTVRTRGDEQGRAVVEVEDCGAGMPPEVLSRIFDPFFTTKPVGSGLGLGLSISHGVVTAHRGEFHVSSQVGVGTVFRIAIPGAHKG